MGTCTSSPTSFRAHDLDVWTSKFMSLHRQIENPQYFILLKKRYILQDVRFNILMNCHYSMFPRSLRKRLPRDIFEDVLNYDVRVKKQYGPMYSYIYQSPDIHL